VPGDQILAAAEISKIESIRLSNLPSPTCRAFSSLASQFRIITYDLRGHGDSTKPADPAMYREGQRWGDDLHAVIAFRPEFLPSAPLLPALGSSDLQVRSRGIVQFLRACFLKQPGEKDFEEMVAFNGMVPLVAQLSIQQMSTPGPAAVLSDLKLPVLIVYGDQDNLVNSGMEKYAHELISSSRMDPIRESGHAPFYEQSARFNSDLSTFLHAAAGPLTHLATPLKQAPSSIPAPRPSTHPPATPPHPASEPSQTSASTRD
jgi:non-heme chloroperoxidase